MVIALGPGKFYGSSLPRPRIYTDIKYNTYRVDPPVSVLDPFMSWAEEAHWSMGGLSFNRHRLQGRIEGDIDKIRNHIETSIKKREESLSPKLKKFKKLGSKKIAKKAGKSLKNSPVVPPAPIANKRKRRFVGLVDEEDDDVADDVSGGRKWPVRKLSDEFDRVATKKGEIEGDGVAARTRGRKVAVSETVKSDDVSGGRKWPVRKLSDEFDRVATKKGEIEGDGVAARTRGRKVAVSETVKSGLKGRKRLRKVGDVGVAV
ncbi:hypothetical protein CTI12_AA203680 [Artemisia annua]|uniref:Uncharacterized protein n=1 Tax=Artemisia annua TaxID=35608 RepID=A0A2U1P1H3_ARTAN|nr:hypothetical protein CTI12_AA203680 [Artemisia annua]